VSARTACAALLAATALLPASLHAAEADSSGYRWLLHSHIAMLGMNGVSVATAFDYVGLRERPRTAAGLGEIHRRLLAIPPSRMTPADRKAWAINLYNFLVIENVIAHFGTDGRPPASVRDVKGFFDDPVVEVEGRRYSLNAFERHFLFADFDRTGGAPPPEGLDPRVHFVLVCAARGCPPLAARPHRAATLDADLDAAVRSALLAHTQLRSGPRPGVYQISSIFDWYANDFGGRAGVLEFLKRYAPAEAAGAIAKRGGNALGGFIPWDWRLNQSGPPARGEEP
jgi:hypothetical protein